MVVETFDAILARLINPYQAAYLYEDGDMQSLHPNNDLSTDKEQLSQLKEKYTRK